MIPILVDCDDCIADFTGSALHLAAEKFNVFATPEDVTKPELWDSIGCPHLPVAIDDAVLDNDFVYRMKPIAAGMTFLRQLEAKYGVQNVYVCTAPWSSDSRGQEIATGEWASQRYAWLRDVARVPRKRVIMCNAKHLVNGVLIDDSPKNIKGRDFGYCIAKPNNASYTGPRGNYGECFTWLGGLLK